MYHQKRSRLQINKGLSKVQTAHQQLFIPIAIAKDALTFARVKDGTVLGFYTAMKGPQACASS
jgi:hypothetical protein